MDTRDFDIEEIFQALGSLSGLTLQVHRDFKPIYVTEDYARLYGFPDTESFLKIGSILELIPEPLRDIARQRYRTVMTTGQSESMTLRALRNDQREVWVKVQDRRILYQGEYAALTIIIDIDEEVSLRHAFEAAATAEQQAKQELLAMQKKLVEQEKQRALNSLLKGVSHQLNTPLGTIKTATSVIENFTTQTLAKLHSQSLKLTDLQTGLFETAEAVFLLEKNTLKASNLINNVKMMVSEGSDHANQHFQFAEMVRDAVSLLSDNHQNLTVTVNIDINEHIEAYADPTVWLQVLSILSDNAVKHGFADRAKGTISIISRYENNELALAFRDNGCGIQREQRDRVFEAFYSSQMGNMSGLGLAMAYSLVSKQLGGSITLDDDPVGTTFIIRVPAEHYRLIQRQ